MVLLQPKLNLGTPYKFASRAATRRTDEEIAALEASVEAMKHAVRSGSVAEIAAGRRAIRPG